AVYELSLTIPASWEAMSNADIKSTEEDGDVKIVHFEPSDLISTYLFSFTAGVYKVERREIEGRQMEFFYRETDSVKLKTSVPAIFEMHAQSLKFMEEYTAIPHPFKKFSFAAIPD